VEDGGGREVVV